MRFPWTKKKEKNPEINIGLIDGVKNKRIGLIFLYIYTDGKYTFCKQLDANTIFEVTEIFNDKTLSKVKVDTIIYNRDNRVSSMNQFNVWIPNTQVYWLEPSTPINRDNKLDELLS